MDRYYEARYRMIQCIMNIANHPVQANMTIKRCFPDFFWGGEPMKYGPSRSEPRYPLNVIQMCEFPSELKSTGFDRAELCDNLGIPMKIFSIRGKYPQAWPPPPETLSQLVGQMARFGSMQVMHEGEKHLVTFIAWKRKKSIAGHVLTQEDVDQVRNIALCPTRFFALDR